MFQKQCNAFLKVQNSMFFFIKYATMRVACVFLNKKRYNCIFIIWGLQQNSDFLIFTEEMMLSMDPQ